MNAGEMPSACPVRRLGLDDGWVFVGRTHGLPAATMRGQAACALERIDAVLRGEGLRLRDTVGARYLVRHGTAPEGFAACCSLLTAALGDRLPRPTYVAAGLAAGVLIEIELRLRSVQG